MTMSVKLVSYTQTPEGTNLLGQIAYVARVSNPANQNNNDTAEKLVRYLIKNKHWSPLEMVDATLEIQTTRDIAHQILRHRSFSFQEFSQRYAVADMENIFSEARLQDLKNRQNSIEVEDAAFQAWWDGKQKFVAAITADIYREALDKGIAKEVARKVLSEGITRTKMYMKGSIRSWVHYIDVRTEPSTQKEHREVALACAAALEPVFPMIKEFVK